MLLALSIILLQIALTRVFAIMMWHHLTYMVVSIAMLGFGAAGSFLTATRNSTRKTSPLPLMALCTTGFAASIAGMLWLTHDLTVDSLKLGNPMNMLRLAVLYVVVSIPHVLAGMGISLALTRYREVNKIYFVDLVGSAIGGAISVPILANLGNTTAIGIATTVAAVSGLCFALGHPSTVLRAATGLGVLGAGAFVVMLPSLDLEPKLAPGKELRPYTDEEDFTRIPSATAEVEVAPSHLIEPALGGNISVRSRHWTEQRWVGQDGTAPTRLYEGAADLDRFAFLHDTQAATAYLCRKAAGADLDEVMVIGVGGGVDVMVALANGADHVTAVEINTGMIEMVTERFDDYLGGLFTSSAHAGKIDLVNSEGRSFARSSNRKFDVIQMSGVDSFTALSTGAYTLAESYLYTVEAVQEFYAHLDDGGYINYSRFIQSDPSPPRETIRLANIARTALGELGIDDPAKHIAVFQGHDWASTMIKKEPFTTVETDALRGFALDHGYIGLLYDPTEDGPRSEDELVVPGYGFNGFADSFVNDQWIPATVSAGIPPPDERSFAKVAAALAEIYRGKESGETDRITSARTALSATVPEQLHPLLDKLVTDMEEFAAKNAPGGRKSYAKVSGMYHTLMRGSEAERDAFIASYEFDISATTDDAPFFFNYYRYGQLLDLRTWTKSDDKHYHPDFPVGHIVLVSSLVQIVLLAALLIFLPLRWLRSDGSARGTKNAPRYFLYFAALGAGFMFVEIVLMQKLALFLGHPTYSVSVVLTSLLFFAGLGSLAAGKLESPGRIATVGLTILVAGAIVWLLWMTESILPSLIGLQHWLRLLIAVGVVAPIGFVLGMPMPTGLRIVRRAAPTLLPWCWAVNGFLSVFGSLFAIAVSMVVGFHNVLLSVIVIYAIGLLAMPVDGAAEESSDEAEAQVDPNAETVAITS